MAEPAKDGKARGEDSSVGLGEQNRDAPAERRELVTVMAGKAHDDAVAFEAAKVIGRHARWCRGDRAGWTSRTRIGWSNPASR